MIGSFKEIDESCLDRGKRGEESGGVCEPERQTLYDRNRSRTGTRHKLNTGTYYPWLNNNSEKNTIDNRCDYSTSKLGLWTSLKPLKLCSEADSPSIFTAFAHEYVLTCKYTSQGQVSALRELH